MAWASWAYGDSRVGGSGWAFRAYIVIEKLDGAHVGDAHERMGRRSHEWIRVMTNQGLGS